MILYEIKAGGIVCNKTKKNKKILNVALPFPTFADFIFQ